MNNKNPDNFENKFRYDLDVFGVKRINPGWIYCIKNGDLIKIGKTINPDRRLKRDAKTWLPDMEIIGAKPFWSYGDIERAILTALSRYWYKGEWYKITPQEDLDFFIEGFCEFYDDDRDSNSVDFIYWMNSSGFAEFTLERSRQEKTLPKFLKQESDVKKK